MILIITPLIFFAWLIFFSNFFRPKNSVAEILLFTLLSSLTQIYLVELFLGAALHKLTLSNVNILNSILLIVVLAITFYFFRSKLLSGVGEFLRTISTGTKTLIFANPVNLSLAILCLIVLIRSAFYSSILTPYDWDGLEYHLPAVLRILQHGSIVDHADFRLYAACIFPFAQELLVGYFSFMFGPIKSGMALPLIYIIIAWLALYEIFKTLSFSRVRSLLGALLFTFLPVLIVQLNSFYIDVAFSTLFIVALLAVLKIYYQKDKLFLYSALGGLAAGLMLASKYTALFALPAIVIIYIVSLIRNRVKAVNILKSVLIILFSVSLVAGYWYAKNAINYKNPLAPYKISVAGHTIFNKYNFNNDIGIDTNIPKQNQPAALYNASWPVKISAIWSEALLTDYSYDIREGGLGVIWWAIFIPAILFSIIISIVKKERRDIVNWLLMFCAAVIPFLLFGYSRWWTRYILFIVPFGIFSYLIILKYLPQILRRFHLGLLILLAIFVTFATSTQSYWNIQTLAKLMQNKSQTAAGLLYGDVWQFLSDSSNKTIVYGEYHVFLATLFGKNNSNKVYYFQASDCNQFIDNIDRVDADWYLAVNPDQKRAYMDEVGDPQNECLIKTGRLGKIIYSNEQGVVIYEIKH